MQRAELISAAVLTVLGLVAILWIIPDHVTIGMQSGELSPAFMPYVAAALGTAAMALLLVVRIARRVAGTPDTDDAPPPLPRQSWYFIGTASLVLVVTFVLMSGFGYLVGAAAIVAGFMAIARARAKIIVGAAVSFPVALWLLFDKLLGFPLP